MTERAAQQPTDPGDAGGVVLLVSTSPRMTWLWAPDAATASAVRAVLNETGHYWQPARRGKEIIACVTDVEIGVTAGGACAALAAAGYTFAWHGEQHPLNRDGWAAELPGMPGAGGGQ
jgi:hypothetical protein